MTLIAYAILFGIAQELVTRLIDQKANAIGEQPIRHQPLMKSSWVSSTRVRTKIDEWFGRARCFRDQLSDRGRTFRFGVGVGLFGLAFLVLVILNMSLRAWGLWGDLAFALIVMTTVLWMLFRAARPLLGRDKKYTAFPRALSATVTTLVGAPVAFVTWPVGLIVLLAPVGFWLTQLLTRLRRGLGPPPLWPAALAGVALLLIYVGIRAPLSKTDIVPRAIPAAQLEDADVELADHFRPLLFLDAGEKRYPLDIEDAIAEGRISMCRGRVRGDDCKDLATAAEIDDSFDYLQMADAPPPRRGGDDGSAYYYRVDRRRDAVYVDYWWFYARNPSPVAGDVFCGPGLRTPPFTCQEHAGDWEGLTVVLGPCAKTTDTCVEAGGDLLGPVTVRYAQHEHVRPYAWLELEGRWGDLPRPTSAALGPVWDEFVSPAAADHGPHPLVFVARDSHASYPDPCFGKCTQKGRDLPEGRHDGGLPWAHNLACDGCVIPLPLTAGGNPALWNAFSGRWGEQECILGGAYCDFSPAPHSPSYQKRYNFPGG